MNLILCAARGLEIISLMLLLIFPSNYSLSQTVSQASLPFKNAGSEECSAYLQTMTIKHYESLPNTNIFLQSDVLICYRREGKLLLLEHSPFHNFADLVNATESWVGRQQSGGLGFLAYAPPRMNLKNITEIAFVQIQ